MAERRMFAKTIVLSDAFLDLPMSARCLYFTLGMLADDDGFVNAPRSIMRQCGASDDDMKVLIAKKFVLLFDNGVIVIKHWRLNNYIQKDRYKETKYKFEKAQLYLDENNSYSMTPQGELVSKMDTECIHDVSNSETQVRVRLELGKSKDNNTLTDFDRFWTVYPKKVGKEAARKAFAKVKENVETLITAVEQQIQSEQWQRDGGQYIPNPATWLNQGRWNDELAPVTSSQSAPQMGKNFKVSNDPSKWTNYEGFKSALSDLLS